MFSTGPGVSGSLVALWLGGETLEIVVARTSEPLAIGVVYMKFFVDTADVAEIKDLAASGLLDGVTTNPSLIAKSGRPMLDVIKEICAIVPGPVSAETVATDHKTMLEEGRKLAKIAKNVAVKVPLTPDGLKTCKALTLRRHDGERHALLLGGPGAARGQGRRHLHLALRRPARRYRPGRHAR